MGKSDVLSKSKSQYSKLGGRRVVYLNICKVEKQERANKLKFISNGEYFLFFISGIGLNIVVVYYTILHYYTYFPVQDI